VNFRKKRIALMLLALPALGLFATRAAEKHEVTGVLLRIDREHSSMLVSCKSIPGYMDAMVMSFTVREAKALDSLQPGETIEFTFVADGDSVYAEDVQPHTYQNLELDPSQTRRLKILESVAGADSSSKALAVGEAVPDFALTDEKSRRVTLSQFSGKVVALTFVYTRCPFPNYCFRLTNNFSQLQKRFDDRMGRDLVLLTILIDSANDGPTALGSYGSIWKADSKGWHFLTGALPDLQVLCRNFDMNFYPDEALLVHSFHTVIIDRHSRLAANLEGNDFTSKQLGDLVETILKRPK
jgi:protein SCO1/2